MTNLTSIQSSFSAFLDEAFRDACLNATFENSKSNTVYLILRPDGYVLSPQMMIFDPPSSFTNRICLVVPTLPEASYDSAADSYDDFAYELCRSAIQDGFDKVCARIFDIPPAVVERRGRPSGIPRDGVYGRGVKTEVMRVPVGTPALVVSLLNDLPLLVSEWEKKTTHTRDWVQCGRFIQELRDQFPILFDDLPF